MSLRRSPRPTSASLAARRANAGKSTGPRTGQGKARAALNALKHGRYAVGLAEGLVEAGCPVDEARWQTIRDRMAQVFAPPTPAERAWEAQAEHASEARAQHGSNAQPPRSEAGVTKYQQERQERLERMEQQQQKRIDQLANWVWCAHRGWRQAFLDSRPAPSRGQALRGEDRGVKLESLAESVDKLSRLQQPSMNCARVQIRHPWARMGMVFYTQRRRGWMLQQAKSVLWEMIDPGHRSPEAGPELESGLRSRAYRLARPRYWERIRYCLDREGYYHPEWQGPYRQARAELRQAGLAVLLEPHPIRELVSEKESVRQQEEDRQREERQ